MKKIKLILFCFFAIVPLLVSCETQDSDDVKTTESIEILDESKDITVDSSVTEAEMKFTANTSWAITLSDTKATPSWVTLSAMSGGAGNVSITITLDVNESSTDRVAYITIIAEDDAYTATITQSGKVEDYILNNGVYEIYTANGLRAFADIVNSTTTSSDYNVYVNGELMNDIDLGGIDSNGDVVESNSFTSIGSSTCRFSGVFDGNGYEISGLCVATGGDNHGLFGYVYGLDAKIKNVKVSGYIYGTSNVGGIAGYVGDYASISNCHNASTIHGISVNTGGVVGSSSYAYITECHNTGIVNGYGDGTGGIVGSASSSYISMCYNNGDVGGVGLNKGGIVGSLSTSYWNSESHVDQCYNTGYITGGNQIGGIAGSIGSPWSSSIVSNCYNAGEVESTKAIGGIAGTISSTSDSSYIKNCYNIANITGDSYTGSIVGSAQSYMSATYISYCYWPTDTTGDVGVDSTNYSEDSVIIGMSSTDMLLDSFVTTLNNLENSNIWVSDSKNINNGYPIFNWQ